jgi:hypothetical protein
MNKNTSPRTILLKVAAWLQSRPAVMDLLVVVAAVALILVGGYL